MCKVHFIFWIHFKVLVNFSFKTNGREETNISIETSEVKNLTILFITNLCVCVNSAWVVIPVGVRVGVDVCGVGAGVCNVHDESKRMDP